MIKTHVDRLFFSISLSFGCFESGLLVGFHRLLKNEHTLSVWVTAADAAAAVAATEKNSFSLCTFTIHVFI